MYRQLGHWCWSGDELCRALLLNQVFFCTLQLSSCKPMLYICFALDCVWLYEFVPHVWQKLQHKLSTMCRPWLLHVSSCQSASDEGAEMYRRLLNRCMDRASFVFLKWDWVRCMNGRTVTLAYEKEAIYIRKRGVHQGRGVERSRLSNLNGMRVSLGDIKVWTKFFSCE